MKRALHIFLLSYYLFSGPVIQEIGRLPILFQHFHEHQQLDQQISFITFLVDHYNDIPHTDNDEDRDNQLPFKTHSVSGLSVVSPALPVSFETDLKKIHHVLILTKTIIINDYIPNSSYTGKIWQPPKSFTLS